MFDFLSSDDIAIVVAGGGAFAVAWLVGSSVMPRDVLGPRIKALQERRRELKGQAIQARRRDRPKTGSMNFIRTVVTRLKLLRSEQTARMQQMLIQAGWRSKDAIIVYAFFQFATPIAFAIIGFILADIDFSNPTDKIWKWLIFVGAIYFGYKLPLMVISRRRKKRYYFIQRALADTLDLMMICAEAGLSLAATLDRVSRELGNAYPEMADELALASIEMGFLPDRKKALTNLSDRVEIAEVRGIVNVLVQTEKYGTPISQALRVLASEFRTQRMLRAEAKAARLPALMTVPMIVFILPTLFVVIMAPAIIKLLDIIHK